MPRTKGHDARAARMLELLENARFNLGRRMFEAREIETRIRQARMRTNGALDGLLLPGEERLKEHMNGLAQYIEHIDQAISTLRTP